MKPRFDSLILAYVTDSLQQLRGAQVQRLGVSTTGRIILSAYQQSTGEKHWLFDISAAWARTHLTRSAPSSRNPSAFESALRKYVLDGVIDRIAQRSFDRVIEVDIDGPHGAVQLIGEFTGHRSNLILCRPESNGEKSILHAAKLIHRNQNRHREILPGRVYQGLPHQGKLDPRSFTNLATSDFPAEKALWGAWLKSTFEGIGPLLEQEILYLANADLGQGLRLAMQKCDVWQPGVFEDKDGNRVLAYPFPLAHLPTFNWRPAVSIDEALETVHRQAAPQADLAMRKSTFEGILKKALQHGEHALRQVQQGLGESNRAAKHRRFGELLYAHLHAVSPGAAAVTVQDFYSGEDVSIALDPDLSPAENAARYFERAKHSEARRADLELRRAELDAKQRENQQLLERVQNAASLDELHALQPAALRQAEAVSRKKQDQPLFDGHRVKSLQSPDGYEVLIGENATSNDYLVRQVMKPNDWWMHLRGATSAHAVVRTGGAPQKVPQRTLQFAAREVAKRSAAKHAGYSAVDYTLGKYVRKPRKSAPGSVNYEREKTLHLMKDDS